MTQIVPIEKLEKEAIKAINKEIDGVENLIDTWDAVDNLITGCEARDEKIEELTMAVNDGLVLIEWFETWLNNRDLPIQYEQTPLTQNPPKYFVAYDARSVAKFKVAMRKALGEIE